MAKRTIKQSKKHNLLQSATFFCFIFIFGIILLTLLCLSWIPYCKETDLPLPNILSLIIGLIITIPIYFLTRKISISEHAFKIILPITFISFYILQLIMLYFTYFHTGWDAGYLNSLSDSVVTTGSVPSDDTYLSLYPNNTFLTAIFAIIKSVPFFGHQYFLVLVINALLVNLACLFTCLSIKKIKSSKTALLSLLILIPLLLFSPWIIIPYSDTFGILLPILTFYLYISCHKWWKYPIITFVSIIGYFIKPTIIIMFIAIIMVELFNHRFTKPNFLTKQNFKRIGITFGSILLAFLIRFGANQYIGFHQDQSVKPISFVHYLAMGQNDENCGKYSGIDAEESKYGTSFELNKFKDRLLARTPCTQLNFFIKKLLTNYDNGTFAWSGEGHFYFNIPERDNNILTSYFYKTGEHYLIFVQVSQIIWLFILFGCLFIKYQNPNSHLVLYISLIGLFLFVTLFEARARYLFCYAPIFVICAVIGYSNLKNSLYARFNRSSKTSSPHPANLAKA